jgi:hypothetical protein
MKKDATIEYFYMGEFRALDVPRDLAESVQAALQAGGASSVKIYWRLS